MKFVQPKTLGQMGKKGAFYRSPEKLAVGGHSDRRLRPKSTGDSGQGRRFRPASGLLPDWRQRRTTLCGEAGTPETPVIRGRRFRPDRRLRGFSGVPPDTVQERTTQKHSAAKNRDRRLRVLWGGDSGVTGDSIPSPGKIQPKNRTP